MLKKDSKELDKILMNRDPREDGLINYKKWKKQYKYELLDYNYIHTVEEFSLIGKGVTMFVDGLKEGNPLAVTLAATMGILSFNLLKSAIAGIWTTLSEIPFGVGLALAGVATAGLISMVGKASSMKDGVIDPKKGPVVSGGFGSVQLDPKDQIVAGTNLMPNGGGRAQQQSPSIDYDKMASAMSRVQVQTNLDGVNVSRKLQTPMGIATRKL
jgi:hypothetical protein